MSKELSVIDKSLDKVLTMWNDPEQVKEIQKIYGKDLTDGEFKTFVQMGIATGLNPFLREIWAVKYDKSKPAQIFIGRDGYRKVIGRNEHYDGHNVDAVYSNDNFMFDITKGEITHTFNFKDRGKLVGAYCLVIMKNISRPFYVFVEVSEYNKGFSVWKDMPATMIKKVAECQAIRMADSTTQGTYSEDEMPDDRLHLRQSNATQLNDRLRLTQSQTYEGEINRETGEVTQPEQKLSDSNAPAIAEVKAKLEAATTIDQLNDVVSILSDMKLTPEEKSPLSALYRARLKNINEAQ